MTEQDKKMLAEYRQACELLNSLQERLSEEKDLESAYHSAMEQCDYYIWYFSKLGLDANQLLVMIEE